MNLKEQIARADDRKVKVVPVEEWGCTVYLRQLSVDERNALVKQIDEAEDGRVTVFILLHSLCDHEGNPVFGPEDYAILAGKNARVVDRLGREASELNMMLASSLDDAKKD